MNFILQKAASESYRDVVTIIRTVSNNMEQKEWYVTDADDDTFKMLLEEKGTAFIAIEKKTSAPAAVFTVTYPGFSSENLGLDAGISTDALSLVAHMDSAAVLPAYRGHGLQRKLMEYAESYLRISGYRYLFCTIHPDNQYSLNNALSLDYKIVTICEKYGGFLRAVLMKEIAD